MFGDSRLQRLIEVALEHNRDLRLAVLNVSQVQAQYDIQRSYRVPGVDAGLEGSRQRSSSDGGNSTAIQETRSASLGVSAFDRTCSAASAPSRKPPSPATWPANTACGPPASASSAPWPRPISPSAWRKNNCA